MSNTKTAGSLSKFLDRQFQLTQNNTSVKTEFLGGLTTFLTCIYIVAVNPAILSACGMDAKSVFWATAVSAGIACIAMGLFTNYPFALAPAMGVNSYFAFHVCGQLGLTWENALGCTLVSGIVFILLSLLGVQERIINAIPDYIKHAISAAIGFFIAFSGLNNAHIIAHDDATLLTMGDLSNPGALLALFGIVLTIILTIRHVKGAILIGILSVTVLGLFVTNPETGMSYTAWPEGGLIAFDNPMVAMAPTFGKLSFKGMFTAPSIALGSIFTMVSFLFMDLFNSIGVLIGVGSKAGFLNEKGEFPRAGQALMVSAGGAAIGAILGTNTVTVYGAESSTGIAEGGRTGLTAVFIGLLFFASTFLSPLFLMIPALATTPALVMVGVFMIEPLSWVDLGDVTKAFPVFLCVAIMAFTFNITYGIVFAMLGYAIAEIAAGRAKKIDPVMWGMTILFAAYLILEFTF